jgi:hypothetical protein
MSLGFHKPQGISSVLSRTTLLHVVSSSAFWPDSSPLLLVLNIRIVFQYEPGYLRQYNDITDWPVAEFGFDSQRPYQPREYRQYPIETNVLSLEVNRPGRGADDSPPSSTEAKNARVNLDPQYVFRAWCLVKHRDNFIVFQYLLDSVQFS